MVPARKSCFGVGSVLDWAGEVGRRLQGSIPAGCCDDFVSQTARVRVDERGRLSLAGWRMRTRSGRGGRGQRDVGVRYDGSTGK